MTKRIEIAKKYQFQLGFPKKWQQKSTLKPSTTENNLTCSKITCKQREKKIQNNSNIISNQHIYETWLYGDLTPKLFDFYSSKQSKQMKQIIQFIQLRLAFVFYRSTSTCPLSSSGRPLSVVSFVLSLDGESTSICDIVNFACLS